ncbi:MAG: hypothetical protein CMJ75_02695 [Planctomycetaceae bacterium]|nr:hypothetical protein [Planctomycetaceae bacterium]
MSKWLAIIPTLLLANAQILRADDIDQWLSAISKTGADAAGSREARAAADQLKGQGVVILPRLLEAMDTPNVVAANWYRTVFDDIMQGELKSKSPQLPLPLFREVVRDTRRQGRLRRYLLAFLDRFQPDFRQDWMAGQLDDVEFREEAVAIVLDAAQQAKQKEQLDDARSAFQKAFQYARREDQVRAAADGLQALGLDVSIVKHMGFVTQWYLLGPFDAPGKTGFKLSLPPETKVDLQASYNGQDGNPIHWKPFKTSDRMGQVNLVQAIAPVKEAVGYAYTELSSPQAQQVQLRCGADDNLSVWINEKLVLARLQWLNGPRLDRFTATVSLRQGVNRVLVKICQGPQHKNPAVSNNWSMQLRFCDKTGAAVGLKTTLPANIDP